jgi:hypothetical protein
MLSAIRTGALCAMVLLPSMAAGQQVLLINPTPLPPPIDLSRPALVRPMLPNNPEGGLKLPDTTGPSLMPSLTMPPTDPIPSERSQQPVPALRLRIPL